MSGPVGSGRIFIPLFATADEVEELLATSEGYEPSHAVVLPREGAGSSSSAVSGERADFREGMDRMMGSLIENGASREYADRVVRESARRNHARKSKT